MNQKNERLIQLIDTLESFAAKFSRMQDTIADKLLPVFLKTAGEPIGTVIENLNRAERLALISNTQKAIKSYTYKKLFLKK